MFQSPITTGIFFALLAAVSFGASTPFIQRLGAGVGPFTTAAVLYAGAAISGLLFRRKESAEAPLRMAHVPRLLRVAVCGAFVAPVALAWGLQRASGTAASLLLNLEAVFTFALGLLIYREHAGARVFSAAALITAGGALLVIGTSTDGAASLLGLAAIVVATTGWALDNTLSRPLADLDPGTVVAGKGLIGGALSVILAFYFEEARPSALAVVGLALCGVFGYGLSLRFYLLAQRRLGAARTGSVFAAAPFVGAAIALGFGQPLGGVFGVIAGLAMLAGVWLHITESHKHSHTHEPVVHTHAHDHADGHHDHVHDPMPSGPHSHEHVHDSRRHDHPHSPDTHHGHTH
jgi:drug/metabolite transporter (DMT)-like permease